MTAPGFAPRFHRDRAQRLHVIASDLEMIGMALAHLRALVQLLTEGGAEVPPDALMLIFEVLAQQQDRLEPIALRIMGEA